MDEATIERYSSLCLSTLKNELGDFTLDEIHFGIFDRNLKEYAYACLIDDDPENYGDRRLYEFWDFLIITYSYEYGAGGLLGIYRDLGKSSYVIVIEYDGNIIEEYWYGSFEEALANLPITAEQASETLSVEMANYA